MLLTNAMINTINADIHTAQTTLDAAITAHAAIPARLPLAQVNPGQQVLDTETKLIHHAIRIAALQHRAITWPALSSPPPATAAPTTKPTP